MLKVGLYQYSGGRYSL